MPALDFLDGLGALRQPHLPVIPNEVQSPPHDAARPRLDPRTIRNARLRQDLIPDGTILADVPHPVIPLAARQASPTDDFTTIPASYGDLNSSPAPGAVVGITMGSVAGFLLLIFLLYACMYGVPVFAIRSFTRSRSPGPPSESVVSRSVLSLRSASRHRPRRAAGGSERVRPRRGGPAETIEIRERTRERVPIIVGGPGRERREPIIVDAGSRGPSRAPSRVRAPPPPRVVPREEPRYSDFEEDEVVVIEEHDPPPRRRQSSRRPSVYSSDDDDSRVTGRRY